MIQGFILNIMHFFISFQASLACTEKDMRFVYCAVCICYILKDFTRINVPKLVEFIKNSFVRNIMACS